MKNVIMAGVVVVVLVGAVWMYSSRTKETRYPKTGYETQWMCEKCKKHIEMTPTQYSDWVMSKDKVRRDASIKSKQVVFWCGDCSAFSVVRASVADDGTWYIPTDSQGNPMPIPEMTKPPGEGEAPKPG